MLDALKKVLTKTPAATTPSVIPSAPLASSALIGAQVQKKQKELACGKARTQVDRLTAPIDEAHAKALQLNQQIAEGLAEDRDVTALMDELTQVRGRLRALEAARELAKQKHDAAHRDLIRAEQSEVVEFKVEVLTRLQSAMRQFERKQAETEPFVNDYGDAFSKACDVFTGDPSMMHTLKKIQSVFDYYIYKTNRMSQWQAYKNNPLLEKPFSEWCPDPDSVRNGDGAR